MNRSRALMLVASNRTPTVKAMVPPQVAPFEVHFRENKGLIDEA